MLDEETEIDETYVNAGLKGRNKRKGKGRIRGRKGRGRGSYDTDRPPVFTIKGRDTGVVIYRAEKDVKSGTVKKVARTHIKPGNIVYTDDFRSYWVLERLYRRRIVRHSEGIYAIGDASINGAEGENLSFKVFLMLKRGVSKECLDEYCACATIWANIYTMSPRGALLRMLCWLFQSNQRRNI